MRWLAGLGLLGAILLSAPASATTLEPVGIFTSPTFITSYPDDEDRLLVVEREGRVQLVTGGTTSMFLDATSLVGTITGERHVVDRPRPRLREHRPALRHLRRQRHRRRSAARRVHRGRRRG